MDKIKKTNFKKVLGYFLAILLGAAVTFSILAITKPKEWNPLGPYPEQRIITDDGARVRSSGQKELLIPLVHISEGVILVSGSKCSKEKVEVESHYGWWSAYPDGFHSKVADGPPGKIIEGCQSFTFENKIPDEVKEWAETQIKKGKTPEAYLSGCETPIDDKGIKGTEVCWTTETFAFNK